MSNFGKFSILHYTDGFFIHIFRQKSNLYQFIGHFFHRIFQFFASNHHLKSALFFKNSIYTSISALSLLKNDAKQDLFFLSILPYTDGFLGSIFDILGRFAKMSPPPKYSQNVAKKRILSNESGQNLKKEPKWPDLVDPKSHQYRVKWRKFPKFPIFCHFPSNFQVFSTK